MPKSDKFEPGDLVFAKVKGYPPWPARITGMASKDRYKIYFYGTYETANLKNEDIWNYTETNKDKFAPKNLKRKGYSEGLDELENNPELAAVDDDVYLGEINTKLESSTPVSKNRSTESPTKKAKNNLDKTDTTKPSKNDALKTVASSKKLDTATAAAADVKTPPTRAEKRKSAAIEQSTNSSQLKHNSDKETPAKKLKADHIDTNTIQSSDSNQDSKTPDEDRLKKLEKKKK